MYTTLCSVIRAQRMSVSELQKRVNHFYAVGAITFEEKIELDELIYQNATVDAEKMELEKRVAALTGRVSLLEQAVEALQIAAEGGDTGTPSEPETPSTPAWMPWDGVSKDYAEGAVVQHKGKTWRNVLQGMQNVWEPGVVDERYWVEVQ